MMRNYIFLCKIQDSYNWKMIGCEHIVIRDNAGRRAPSLSSNRSRINKERSNRYVLGSSVASCAGDVFCFGG